MTIAGRRRLVLLATISLLIAAVGALAGARAVPAGAATAPGWRIVSNTQYPGSTVQEGGGFGAVVAPSANDAWVFGGTDQGSGNGVPEAQHWNGSAWSQATLPSGLSGWITAASAPAANDIWAVGEYNGWILHYNGSSWSVAKQFTEPPGYPSAFTGITALSPTNVWVFGGQGPEWVPEVGFGTWHYDGKSWTKVTGQAQFIAQASVISATNVWAVGDDGTSTNHIDHYNGSTWQAVSAPSYLADGQYVAAFSSTSVWVDAVANETGLPELGHWTGKSWTQVPTDAPADSFLGEIAGDGQGGLNIVAISRDTGQNWVLHMSSAGTWTRTAVTGQLEGMARVPGTTSLWGAGTLPSPYGDDAVIWADGALP